MEVLSLKELAARAVAKHVTEGKLVINSEVDPNLSNTIFEKIATGKQELPPIPQYQNLHVTEMDFKNAEITLEDIKMINNYNLRSLKLKLNSGRRFGKYTSNETITARMGPLTIFRHIIRLDFKQLMEDCLNPTSRQTLEYLSLGNGENLQHNRDWLDVLLKMLPNLSQIVLDFPMRNPFDALSQLFFQVRYLDISQTGIRVFHGISKLPNLEELILFGSEIFDAGGFLEIFSLTKLKKLDVSQIIWPPRVLTDFLQDDKVLPSLEYIDTSHTITNHEHLAQLLNILPSLKAICLYKTNCSDAVIPGVKVLHSNDIESAFNLLIHFQKINRRSRIQDVLEDMKTLLRTKIDYNQNKELIHRMWNHLLKMVEEFMAPEFATGLGNQHAIQCLVALSKHYFEFLTTDERYRVVTLLANNPHHKIFGLAILGIKGILETPNLDLFKYFQMTINNFIEVRLMNQELSFAIVSAIHDLIEILPVEKRAQANRITECFVVLISRLEGLIDWYDENTEKVKQVSLQFKETAKALLSIQFNDFPFELVMNFVEKINSFDDNHWFKLIFAELTELLLHHVDVKEIPGIPIWDMVALLIKHLPGEYRVSHPDHGFRIEAKLATYIMKILAVILIHMTTDDMLATILRDIADPTMTFHLVPVLKTVNSVEKFDWFTVGSVEEWVASTVKSIVDLRDETSKRNQELFDSKNTPDTIRNIYGDELSDVFL